MGRPKKRPEYNKDNVMTALLEAVSDCYGSSGGDGASLRKVADEFGITHLKARKLLITAGAYNTELSEAINALKAEGLSVQEIMLRTGLSRASVHSYLPYTKVVYNAGEISLNAERLRRYRERQEAVKRVGECLDKGADELCDAVWDAIEVFEGYPFYTVKGLRYKYTIKGQEIFFDRKEKSITRATIDLAVDNVVKMNREIMGPKQIGVFGASYIYPVFKRLGVI